MPSKLVIAKLAIAFCAALVTIGSSNFVGAQQATSPEANEPSATHIAAARQLVISTGISRSFVIAIPLMMERLTTTFTQTRPELAQDLGIVLTELKPEFDKKVDQLIDRAARIFAKLMSEQEIKAAEAFFESEAGKKYVKIQPAFLSEVVASMQDWQQNLSQDMVTRVREEMKKKGHDL